MPLRPASFAALAALLAPPAAAVVTVHDTQAGFLAAVAPGSYLETFDSTPEGSTPGPIAYSGGGFAYAADVLDPPEFSPNLFPFTIPSGDPSDVIMSLNDARDTLVFDFTSGNVTAAGAFFFAADLAGEVTSADVIVDTDQTAPMVLPTGGTTTTFLGFTSDQPFQFLSAIGDSTKFVAFATADDLVVGTAVPEPAHAAMAAVGGAALLAGSARRRP